jgi:peptidoglycan/LPS O-acetylase OafA/YrhL
MLSLYRDLTKHNNIAVLDGVRAIACLLVIGFHVNLIAADLHVWKPYPDSDFFLSAFALGGGEGVTLFFVLSGFLLFLPFARSLLFPHEWPSTRRFYLRRALRIWPGYFVALLLLIWLRYPQYFTPQYWPDLTLFLTFFMDSSPSTFMKLNGPFWTLAVEWQYYMLLPLLALLMRRIAGEGSLRQRWWRLVACLVGLMLWGIATRFWGSYLLSHPDTSFLVPRPVLNILIFLSYGVAGKFLEDFAVGMLIGAVYVVLHERSRPRWQERASALSPWLGGAGLLVLVLMTLWNAYQRFKPGSVTLLDLTLPAYGWFSEIGYSCGFGLCMAGLLFGLPHLRRVLECWPLRALGLLSYGLYIWHLPLLIEFIFQIYRPLMEGWNRALVYLVCWLFVATAIVPFCFLYYCLVERPGIKLGERLLKGKRVVSRFAYSRPATSCQQPRMVTEQSSRYGPRPR